MAYYDPERWGSSLEIAPTVDVTRQLLEEARQIAQDEDLPIDLILLALVQIWAGIQSRDSQ